MTSATSLLPHSAPARRLLAGLSARGQAPERFTAEALRAMQSQARRGERWLHGLLATILFLAETEDEDRIGLDLVHRACSLQGQPPPRSLFWPGAAAILASAAVALLFAGHLAPKKPSPPVFGGRGLGEGGLAAAPLPDGGTRLPDPGVPSPAAHATPRPPAISPPVSPQTAFERGLAADIGSDGPSDAKAALAWYRQAAEAELPAAQLNVAVMADNGRGIARDAEAAATWYAAAAAHGNARAAYDIAQLYAAGDGVPRNEEAARAWFRLAASRGLEAAAGHPVPAASAPPGNALLPAIPRRPENTQLAPQGHDVALVWTAPAQPASAGPIRTYVQVVALNGTTWQTIVAGFVPVTATVVTLPSTTFPPMIFAHGAASYAWRVFTISADTAHYAASAWARFTVTPRVPEPG